MQTDVHETALEGRSGAGEKSALAFAWETIEALGADLSLAEILQSWALAVVKHLDANLARVWTMSTVGLQLQATAEANTLAGDAYTHMPVGAFVDEIADECRPYATNDIRNDPHLMDSEWAKREHLRAFAGHPLMSRGKLVGVAAMVSQHPISDVAMQALATSAAGLALTIRRKRVEAAAKEAVKELKMKNAGLISANQRSQALIDLAPSGILVVDRAGAMTAVNAMAEKMFGFAQGELLRQPADMLLPPPLRGSDAFTGPEERDLSARTDLNGLRKDGSIFPVEIGLVPIDPGGDMRCCIVDITDRADTLKLRKMHAELRAASDRSLQVIESVPNGIVVVDHSGAITLVNAPAERMFGFDRRELIGQPVGMLFPESMRVTLPPEGAALGRALIGVRKDGSEFALEISLNPIPVDREMSVLCSIVDTTERTLAESRLREAARLKSEFLANMSHEIRTPINVMVGMSGLLLETDLTPDQKDLAETIRNGAESLLVVINDSLDFSKMEAGKLEIDPADFEVDGAVEEVTSFFSQSASRKGLALTCFVEHDVPQYAYGDGGRLRQILTNLVGNAIKFTERGGINLWVAVAEAGGAVLRFEVRDSGIGISAEAQERIFQAFAQADGSTTRRYGGTGLGLAIVKRLIEMMGGTIGVQSEPGRGSTFWFQLPFERAREAKGFDPESSARMVGVRVLVAGEEGAAITEQLESWGMETRFAANTLEAVMRIREAALTERPFGLVMLDYRMHGMDAAGIAGMMAGVPVVMMASREDRKAAEKVGGGTVTLYLTTPPRPHHLHKAVAMALLPVEIGGNQKAGKPAALRTGPRLLLVEDNLDNQKLTVRLLGKYGYSCDIANNGAEALRMLMRGAVYPLILMDCQMPEMDGFQATAAIREREGASRHTPIIAMTAHALEGDRDKCLRAGMDDYIAKPVTEELLASTIERWTLAGEVAAAPAAPVEEPAGGHSRVRVVAKEGLEDLIPEYLANCTKSIVELADAVARKDLDTVRGIGHGMKGCGAGYGFAAITDFGRNIENAATGQDEATVSEQISKLGTYLANLEVIYP